MARPTNFAAASVLLLTALAIASKADQICNGNGEKFCETAHEFDGECPMPCTLEYCSKVDPPAVSEVTGHPYMCYGEEYAPTWEQIVDSGLYEYVYVSGDKMCVSTCWLTPLDAACDDWDYLNGVGYCQDLDCTKHDEYNRYVGCHDDGTGNFKLPGHKPTCKECARVFPTACGGELDAYVATQKAQELEEAARVYCYLEALGPMLPTSPPASDSSSRKLLSSSSDSSGSGAGSESSSQGGSTNPADCGTAYNIPYEALQEVQKRVAAGTLTCPADWCLSQNADLLGYDPVGWYLTTDEGYCNFNGCVGGAAGDSWCRAAAGNCVSCSGTWCPPSGMSDIWDPVTSSSYEYTSVPSFASGGSKFIETGDEPDLSCPESLTGLDTEMAGDVKWYDPVSYYMPLW